MTRHELKETDEITSKIKSLTAAVYARKTEVITGAAVLLVIVLGIIGWNLYSANRNANAQSQLAQAIHIFNDPAIKSDKERFERTLAEAQKTRDAYGSLQAGTIALYYIAVCQDGLGDTAKATESFQQVIASGDASIAGVAKFALAGTYRKHGDAQKATDIYKQLYETGGYSKSAAVLELAKLSESSNKMDEAKTYYQKIVSEFPDSPFRQEADVALKRLGVPAA